MCGAEPELNDATGNGVEFFPPQGVLQGGLAEIFDLAAVFREPSQQRLHLIRAGQGAGGDAYQFVLHGLAGGSCDARGWFEEGAVGMKIRAD